MYICALWVNYSKQVLNKFKVAYILVPPVLLGALGDEKSPSVYTVY